MMTTSYSIDSRSTATSSLLVMTKGRDFIRNGAGDSTCAAGRGTGAASALPFLQAIATLFVVGQALPALAYLLLALGGHFFVALAGIADAPLLALGEGFVLFLAAADLLPLPGAQILPALAGRGEQVGIRVMAKVPRPATALVRQGWPGQQGQDDCQGQQASHLNSGCRGRFPPASSRNPGLRRIPCCRGRAAQPRRCRRVEPGTHPGVPPPARSPRWRR